MWDVGCGLGLDASVSRLSRGAVVPRLGLASDLIRLGLVSVSSSIWRPWSRSRLGLNCQRLGLGLQGLVHIPATKRHTFLHECTAGLPCDNISIGCRLGESSKLQIIATQWGRRQSFCLVHGGLIDFYYALACDAECISATLRAATLPQCHTNSCCQDCKPYDKPQYMLAYNPWYTLCHKKISILSSLITVTYVNRYSQFLSRHVVLQEICNKRIVSNPPCTGCVTALPCKMLITNLVTFTAVTAVNVTKFVINIHTPCKFTAVLIHTQF